MKTKEWPLVAFTLLTQAAVGAFLILLFERIRLVKQLPADLLRMLSLRMSLLVILMLAIGAGIATQHLGRPDRAVQAIKNLRSSWLSREMLLSSLFGLGVGLFALLIWRGTGSALLLASAAGISACAGIALVYAIARLYMVRTVPAWNNITTPVVFFTAAFLLGGIIVAGTLLVELWDLPMQGLILYQELLLQSIKRITGLILLTLLLQIITLIIKINYLRSSNLAAQQSANLFMDTYRNLFTARLVLAFGGLAAAFLGLYGTNFATELPVLIIAFPVIWTSELIDRFLFYASHQRVGL